MWLKEMKKYVGLFVFGIILIAIYKTFDNFGYIVDWARNLFGLLTPFIIGGCIAYLLYRPCGKLEALFMRTKVKFISQYRRGLAVVSIYLIFVGAVTLLLFAIIPALARSVKDFIEQFPNIIQGLFDWLNSFGIYEFNSATVLRLFNDYILSADKLFNSFSFDNVNRYAKGVMNVGSTLFDVLLGLVISIYLLLDRKNLKTGFIRIVRQYVPKKHREKWGKYFTDVNKFIHQYISCQLLDALVVFVLSFVVLALLRVKYAILLAVIMGSFNLIPYFGAIIATALAAIVTIFAQGFTTGLIVAVALIVLQQIDANIIQPRLVADSLGLAPVWVILAIVLGGGLFGFFGIFLAVPVFALLRQMLDDTLRAREEVLPQDAKMK